MATFAAPGIKHIAMCDKGTLATSPTNIVILGSRNNEELNINDVEQSDVRERPMIIKRRFETPLIENRQPQLNHLEDLLKTYRDVQGCDVEILCEPQTTGVTGGCFQFTGDNCMGYKTTYEITPDKRVLGIQFGVSLPPATAQTLIDAADSATPATLGISNNGFIPAQERFPWPKLGTSTFKPASVFLPEELLDYSFLLEEVGDDEKLNGRFISNWVRATLTFKFANATVAAMISDMNDSAGVAITFQQDTSGSSATYEKFSFAQYSLRKSVERKIEAKERYILQKYTGLFPKANLAFSYLVGVGGGSSADGTEGGTVTFSL
jgi:hypothetical protein